MDETKSAKVGADRGEIEDNIGLRKDPSKEMREEGWPRSRGISDKESSFSPLVITLITGVLTLIGAVIANHMQAKASLQQERSREQSELILKAIETGDANASARNLLFLLHLGLITDVGGKIAALDKDPQSAPVLPAGRAASAGDQAWQQAVTAGNWSEFDKAQELALQRYLIAMSMEPGNPLYMVDVATAMNRLGRYGEAVPLLKAAIAKQPSVAWYHNELCVALRRSGKIAESNESCQKAIELDPKNKAFQPKLESDLTAAENARRPASR